MVTKMLIYFSLGTDSSQRSSMAVVLVEGLHCYMFFPYKTDLQVSVLVLISMQMDFKLYIG